MKNLPKSLHTLTDQYEKTASKMDSLKTNTKAIQNLTEQVSNLELDMKFVKQEIATIKSDILSSQERIEQTIRTQEEIIMDMINKFNEGLLQHKSSMKEDIETLKTQQDVLKISYTINEKKFMDKVNSSISTIIKKQVEGKENEILMKISEICLDFPYTIRAYIKLYDELSDKLVLKLWMITNPSQKIMI